MEYRIEVSRLSTQPDPSSVGLLEAIHGLGINSIDRVEQTRLFFLEGELGDLALARLANEALVDDVLESWEAVSLSERPAPPGHRYVEISTRIGVTDSVAETFAHGASLLGVHGVNHTATGMRYTFLGPATDNELETIASALLANPVVHQWTIDTPLEPPFAKGAKAERRVEHIELRGMDDNALVALSHLRRLSLNLEEMQAIRAYFEERGRQATDLELEMLAQTWSEHCVHKTFRARIEYQEQDSSGVVIPEKTETINSMLKFFLKRATDEANKPWIRSAFVDNAGIVAFDDELDLALKVETHNHPSALEPFGGSNTGVGGVVRDILGVSARPIANTDVLCFGPEGLDQSQLPEGVLHPRRIASGVIAGIEDYGNKMGIPTVNGAIVYDKGYTANPLVFCGCLGILPTGSHPTEPGVGDLVVVVGGRTGRDGLRGATFSSMEMDHETGDIAGTAVQIGHPIHEKQAQEVVIEARDAELYTAITDCGAGGLSSAVGEMGCKLGVEVQLDDVPLKYPGLQPWEVWLSEAQERMVLAVKPEKWPDVKALCEKHGIDGVSIGRFTGDGVLRVMSGDLMVGELDVEFLHDGIPQRQLRGLWRQHEHSRQVSPQPDYSEALLVLLGDANSGSREEVIRRYDHEVQGGTVGKPLVGTDAHGPGDAAVLVPLLARQRGRTTRGVALGCGIHPELGKLDPYLMARAAVDEAVRNVVAVGGDPDQLSLVDNFCWGNPNLQDRLGGLVQCARGCYEGARAFDAPYISGKDSLNNEYTGGDGEKHAIPGTILITAMAIVPDVAQRCASAFVADGETLILVGETKAELGGGALIRQFKGTGGLPPQPPSDGLETARAVHGLIKDGVARSCHDCSDGGLGPAVAEMALGGKLGVSLDLASLGHDELSPLEALFSESLSRYLVTVPSDALGVVETRLEGRAWYALGKVGGDRLTITMGSGPPLVDIPVETLIQRFRHGN